MSRIASSPAYDTPDPDRFGGGVAGAVGLHALLVVVLIAGTYFTRTSHDRWGESQAAVGAIQASMVSAIPLPSRAKPVEKQVLASEDVNEAPLPPPKAATQPPPKPTDILIKAKTPPPAPPATVKSEANKAQPKSTPTEAPAMKHPQPTPDTAKAQTGETTATQLPSAVSQTKNGTATAASENRVFGARYAYYLRIVNQRVSENWIKGEIEPSAQGKSVTLLFDIDRDGAPQNVRMKARSGAPSLDASAMRAVQRVETFGPLPAGDSIPIEFTFDFKAP